MNLFLYTNTSYNTLVDQNDAKNK